MSSNGQIVFHLDSSYSSDFNVSSLQILPRDAALCSAIQTSRQNFTSSWQCVLCFGIYEPQRQGHDSPTQSNWTTHTQNTAGMSQVYPNLESYVYIVIYIESCNVMHIWSLFTSDGSVAISKCSAKASCTSSAPRLLPLEDLFPATCASNFSKIYLVSFR